MSKYIIRIEDQRKGTVWLDAQHFQYYLFFNMTSTPTDAIRTHLEERYRNVITDKCKFGYYNLYGARGKTVVEGWALKQVGPMNLEYTYSFFPIKEFEERCIEPIQRVREFETVIVLKSDYGHPPGSCNPGWNHYNRGYMAMDISYHIYRRALSIEQSYQSRKGEQDWDYYDIPETKDVMTYLPLKGDITREHNSQQVYAYTPEKHEVLREICDMGLKLGNQLQDLFEVKKLEGGFALEFKEGGDVQTGYEMVMKQHECYKEFD